MKLSEEEKTAIEMLNSYINAIDTFGTIDPKCCNNLYKPTKTVLDIIENLQKEIDNWKFTAKYVEENYISKDKIKKDLETCEKVYEREMKPYQREYGLDVTYLSKKEKEKLINTRNCLITQMETYKQLLEG